jgi:hemolysin activation/secretion protein
VLISKVLLVVVAKNPIRLHVIALATIYLFAMGQEACAQINPSIPDAGSLLREIERQQMPTLPKLTPKPEVKKEQEVSKSEVTVLVKEFKFEGNDRVSTEELQAHYKQYLGKTLTLTDIQNIAAEIAIIYGNKGFVAQGQLPKQDVTNGVILIRIVEAKFGGSVFDEEQKKQLTRVRPSVIEGFLNEGQVLGQLIDTTRLDRSVLIADDLPGVNVQSGLIPGERDGETLVLIQAKDKPEFTADVSADNQGSRSTGEFKKSANLGWASPTGQGDQIGLTVLNSRGTDYGRLSYSVPVDSDGLRAGVNASHMRYEVITPESQSTSPKGTSDVMGFDIQYPIIRSAAQNLNLSAAYDLKYFKNEHIESTTYVTQSAYHLNVMSVGLSGNQYDSYYGGGVFSGSINLGVGQVDLEGSPNQASDAAGARTAGQYSRVRWNMSRQQNVLDDLSMSVTISGQQASKNLDSSEKFYLGGVSGVRAYPNSEGAGSAGQMLNAELNYQLPEKVTASAFYDWGRVNKTTIANLDSYNLSGYGLSVSWVGPYQVNLKGIWARRIGQNPYPTTTGNDQDGTLKRDRFWFSASIPF